ncbi:hypothetical protein CEXT_658861 [Caerostris extrusa]|uniref:Uncharacterized protein n=1 Tax=Caerostris extrusa TaxID=172846 RepID=A0AAV4NI10_CAEEX|nr:hypothetical protein CEXT_658861 [Caerostris extrusa]
MTAPNGMKIRRRFFPPNHKGGQPTAPSRQQEIQAGYSGHKNSQISKEIKKKSRKNASRQRSGYRQDSREPEYLYCSTRGTYPGNGESFASKASTDQALISEAVAREVEKNLPAMAIAQAQTPTYAEMATLRAKRTRQQGPQQKGTKQKVARNRP